MASIVAGQMPVLGLGGHNFWMLKDDSGAVVGQIHGWVFKNGVKQDFAVSGELVATNEISVQPTYQQTILQGSIADLQKRWDAGLTCAQIITANDFEYQMLSFGSAYNSNNVYSTVGQCMGLTGPRVGNALALPGLDELILSEMVINSVLEAFGIGRVDDDELPEISVPQKPETAPMPVTLVGVHELNTF